MDGDHVAGRCFCGAVRFAFSGEPNWVLHCHCESCRRATSSAMTTWISVQRTGFRYTSGSPRYYASSPGVKRGFCETCGAQLTYENDRLADEVHVYAAALDDPSSPVISPSCHVFVAEQVPWLDVHDDLPRFSATRRG